MLASIKNKFAACTLTLLAMIGLAGCGNDKNERKTYEGSYHIAQPINDVKRGVDLSVILNSDQSIYTIAVDDTSEYIPYDFQITWGIFSNTFMANLASLSVSEINAFNVVVDDQGLPTKVEGMLEEWYVSGNTGACGMVVLALQNAFTTL